MLQAEEVAVGAPGAEHPVDPAQVAEDPCHPRLDVGPGRLDGAHVDAHRHAHHGLDPRTPRQAVHGGHRFAWSMADWSEAMYPSEV